MSDAAAVHEDDPVGLVFLALADPTRREVVRTLAEGGSLTATQLAARFPITRQAVAKHLSALADAGLVHGERAGRELRYRLTPEPMADAVTWMAAAGARWDDRLDGLARRVAERQADDSRRSGGADVRGPHLRLVLHRSG